jgi:voltage-gated potassium channel
VMLTAIPLMAAVFANWSASLASNHVRRFLGMEEAKLRHHLVVYGYNDTVAHMLGQLSRRDEVLLVADIDPGTVPEHVRIMAKDPTQSEVVERSQPARADRALIAGKTDSAVLMTAVLVNHFAPDLPKTALVQSPKVAKALGDLGITHCIATDDLVGHTLAKSLETPHAADLLLGIIGNDRWELKEEAVPQEWVGQSLAQVRRQFSGVLLGLVHDQSVVLGVERDPVIEADDHVFVLEVTANGPHQVAAESVNDTP